MHTIRTPRVYRYMEKQYVDDFFNIGRIRLSSFASFSKHKDEQRFDDEEGTALCVHRTSENGGQTLTFRFYFDNGAYVLCGSAMPSNPLMHDFGSDSAIIIRDVGGFVKAVANAVSGCSRSVHGPCSYQRTRAIERDLGWLDIAESTTFDPKEMNAAAIENAVSELVTDDVLFLKPASYSHQVEYRLIWIAEQPDDHIEVVVPDAIQFCERWEEHGEWIAVK